MPENPQKPHPDWTRRTLRTIVVVGILLRVLLYVYSPQPFGYVYDFYHVPIELLYQEQRLPEAADCWVCYHPPLFTMAGLPFYWLGMQLGGDGVAALNVTRLLPALCELLFIAYAYRLLTMFARRGWQRVLGAALLWFFPCSFMSSGGIEADILLSAIMAVFLFWMVRFFNHPLRSGTMEALLLGLFAGFAAETKFSGLLALLIAGAIVACRLLAGPARARVARLGLVILVVGAVIGAPKYLDNYLKYGKPFQGNVIEIGSPLQKKVSWDHYEFLTFRLGDTLDLFGEGAPDGRLTTFGVYRSYWTALHATAWTDMSFFSNPTRHGALRPLYRDRGVPVWLAGAVLLVGIAPGLLALLGAVVTATRRTVLPVHVYVLVSMLVYTWWIFQEPEWTLKAKYILFVHPPFVLYALFGLAFLEARVQFRPARVAAAAFTVLAIGLTVAYLARFAIGS